MHKKKRDDTASLTASANNVSAAYVRMIVKGTRNSISPKASRILKHYKNIIETKRNLSIPVETTIKNNNYTQQK